MRALVPDYASPFLSLFRTPEPQVSQILLFTVLVVLLDLSRWEDGEEPRRARLLAAAGVALNAVLALVYFFQATVIVLLEGILALIFAGRGQRRHARVAGMLALVGAGSIALGTWVYHGEGAARDWTFRSHLPVVTPASILAAVGLILVATQPWRSRGNAFLPVAAACFGTVLALTNQQILTGRMISTRDWERYADYPLVFLGMIALGAWWLRRAKVRLTTLYALAGGGLMAAGHGLVTAQDRVFEEQFLVANLKSVAMKRAVESVEARGYRGDLLVLEDPELAALLQVRLHRRADILVDGAEILAAQIDPLEKTGGEWGRRSRFKRPLFEYFARMGRTPARVSRILQQEVESGAGTSLWFLFDPRDWWTPFTDGRRARPHEVRALLAGISEDYEQYLEAGDPCWAEPAIVLTRQSPAERSTLRWKETFLVEATVGTESPIMNVHALLQAPAAAPPAGTGSGESGHCDP